ncbi:MAG: TolC family protein [Halarcobacter sp.]
MKKLIILPFLCSLIFANDLNLLNKDKKELREVEKKIIQEDYKSLKNSWISPLNLNSGLSRTHSFSDKNDQFSKSVSIGFTQSIYESGGIEFTIEYANEKYKSDLLSWENDNSTLLEKIYETLLQIKKLNIQLEQNEYQLKNKNIELVLKKIQYENGKSDITELNDAIMAKNIQYKTNVDLKNSIKEAKLNLEKYTNLKYEQINLIDFEKIKKDDYLKKNINLLYEKSLVDLANINYKKDKTDYLPKVNLSTNLAYSNNDNLVNNIQSDNSNGSISLNLSVPIYDINKKSNLEKSKLEVLKQKLNLSDIKTQVSNKYEEAITRIDTYENYNKIINENIKLYDDLIQVNEASNSAGMSSGYDLEILKNTKKINQYDLSINDINIQLEYAKLYFNTKVNN